MYSVRYFFAFLLFAQCIFSDVVDRICAFGGINNPILLSDIKRESANNHSSHAKAFESLLAKQGLFLYAKTIPTISFAQVDDAVNKHIQEILKNNNLGLEDFKRLLANNPYNMTLKTFEQETKYQIIRQTIYSELLKKITISEKQLEEYRLHASKIQNNVVVYVSFANNTVGTLKAKKLVSDINEHKLTFNEFLQHNENNSDLKIIGPIDYSTINEADKKKLGSKNATEPFNEGDRVTLIWKFAKHSEKSISNENLAENLKAKLVEEQIYDIGQKALNTSLVIKNCKFD